MNVVTIIGRLAADPELKTTGSGISVTNICVAVDRKVTKGEDKITDWIDVVAWRNTAEFVSKYFNKGRAIVVVGSLQNRSWTDQNGQKRYITEVIADECYFAGNSGSGNGQSEGGTFYGAEPAAQNMGTKPAAATFEELSTEDDLPF